MDPGAPAVLGQAVTAPDLESLVYVLGASALGAIVSRIHGRIVLPTVVVEIVLGIVIGPEVLDLAEVDSYIRFLSNFGLALLFFFAGLEVIERRVVRSSVVRGAAGWAASLAIGLSVGALLSAAGVDAEWWLLGVALSTTALGTLVPILIDAGLLSTLLGSAVLGAGIAGEFWPIVVISIFLTGAYGAIEEALLLVAFGGLVALAATVATRARPPRLLRVLQETLHTTGQAAVRASIFLLGGLVLLANDVGLDFVLGAFAAGLVVGLTLDSPEGATVRMRLEGIGFGLLIPIYFVVAGMNFDLDSFLSATGLALGGLFLGLLLVVRGVPSLVWLRELGTRDTLSLAVFSATGLPLIVAVVGIGADRGAISPDVGASLIGAGMISVLLFPLLAIRLADSRAADDGTRALAATRQVQPSRQARDEASAPDSLTAGRQRRGPAWRGRSRPRRQAADVTQAAVASVRVRPLDPRLLRRARAARVLLAADVATRPRDRTARPSPGDAARTRRRSLVRRRVARRRVPRPRAPRARVRGPRCSRLGLRACGPPRGRRASSRSSGSSWSSGGSTTSRPRSMVPRARRSQRWRFRESTHSTPTSRGSSRNSCSPCSFRWR